MISPLGLAIMSGGRMPIIPAKEGHMYPNNVVGAYQIAADMAEKNYQAKVAQSNALYGGLASLATNLMKLGMMNGGHGGLGGLFGGGSSLFGGGSGAGTGTSTGAGTSLGAGTGTSAGAGTSLGVGAGTSAGAGGAASGYSGLYDPTSIGASAPFSPASLPSASAAGGQGVTPLVGGLSTSPAVTAPISNLGGTLGGSSVIPDIGASLTSAPMFAPSDFSLSTSDFTPLFSFGGDF